MTTMARTTITGLSPGEKRKALVIGFLAVASVGLMVFFVIRATVFAPASPNEASRRILLIDSQSGEIFSDVRLEAGMSFPMRNPKTGTDTLFPPEACYWTREGKAKANPTYVLVREDIGEKGPTMCPDCGRRVVGRNPMPPPELMIEAYKARAGKE